MPMACRLLLRLRTGTEGDARPAGIRVLADVGKPFLDDPIDMRRRRRRQRLEIGIDLKRDLEFSLGLPLLFPRKRRKTRDQSEVVDLWRTEGPQRSAQGLYDRHRFLR